jgi:hypothetical protein
MSQHLPAQRPVYTASYFLRGYRHSSSQLRVVSENPDIVRTARERIKSTAYITIFKITDVNPVSTKILGSSAQYYKVFLTEFSLRSFPYKRTCSRKCYCTIKSGGRELPKAPLIYEIKGEIVFPKRELLRYARLIRLRPESPKSVYS